ncbi:hypothetical protein D3C76_1876380 [compost metagenome]
MIKEQEAAFVAGKFIINGSESADPAAVAGRIPVKLPDPFCSLIYLRIGIV